MLDAALSLFAERGFRGTSLRSIVRRAEVSLGCVQHHFPTKGELEHAVLERAMETLRVEQASAFEAPDEDIESLLHAGMRNHFRWARENPEVMRLGAWLTLEGRDRQWPTEAELDAELVRRMQAAQSAGELRDLDPLLLLTVVALLMNRWAIAQRHHGQRLGDLGEETDERFADFAVDLLLRGARAS